MRALVLGGTGWLGREVALAALGRGHEVVCLARGISGAAPDGARLVRADRERDDAYDDVAGTRWDAVVDVADEPGQVRGGVDALAAARYCFISSTNVYADTAAVGRDESAAPVPIDAPVSGPAAFGQAKVRGERIVQAASGDRALVVRPGLIGGPGDASGRSTYWPWRFAHPGSRAVLVPAAGQRPTQVVDVRDLAAFIVSALERRLGGAFDAVGEQVPFAAHLAAARDAAGTGAALVEAPEAWLLEQGVAPWAGKRSLPLWLPYDEFAGFAARSGERAVAAGLVRRPLVETLRDALAWEEQQPVHPHGAGLTDAEERALLDALQRG